jgi:hypothetical protein
MSLYKTFKTNHEKEENGIDIEYGTNSKNAPIKFRVARASRSNIHYQTVLELVTRPYRRMINGDKLDKRVENKLNITIFVKSILLGWEGVEDENNEPLTFNQENATKLFTDLPDLFAELQQAAADANNFKDDEERKEVEAKNS